MLTMKVNRTIVWMSTRNEQLFINDVKISNNENLNFLLYFIENHAETDIPQEIFQSIIRITIKKWTKHFIDMLWYILLSTFKYGIIFKRFDNMNKDKNLLKMLLNIWKIAYKFWLMSIYRNWTWSIRTTYQSYI